MDIKSNCFEREIECIKADKLKVEKETKHLRK
jgi:hypothetical protein